MNLEAIHKIYSHPLTARKLEKKRNVEARFCARNWDVAGPRVVKSPANRKASKKVRHVSHKNILTNSYGNGGFYRGNFNDEAVEMAK